MTATTLDYAECTIGKILVKEIQKSNFIAAWVIIGFM